MGEVEIQLGATDESHIIRTIEYWDIERKRYPQYDHTAVIVADDITSRFLNVISLFNGVIPLMAIQVTAVETDAGVGPLFTKILDTTKFGYLDEDEEASEPTDRNYWEERGTSKTVVLTDMILEIINEFISSAKLSYTKYYIGFLVDEHVCNFAICRPQKSALRLEIHLPETEETEKMIRDSELDILDYEKRSNKYRLKLVEKDITDKKETLSKLLKQAYDLRK